jgi:hypothetical protein
VVGTDFEVAVTVQDQLQQLEAADLSSDTFIAIFAPAAT